MKALIRPLGSADAYRELHTDDDNPTVCVACEAARAFVDWSKYPGGTIFYEYTVDDGPTIIRRVQHVPLPGVIAFKCYEVSLSAARSEIATARQLQ